MRNENLQALDNLLIKKLSKNSSSINQLNTIYEKYISYFLGCFPKMTIEELFQLFIKMTGTPIEMFEREYVDSIYKNFIRFLCEYYLYTMTCKEDETIFVYVYHGVTFNVSIDNHLYGGIEYKPNLKVDTKMIAHDIVNSMMKLQFVTVVNLDCSIQTLIDNHVNVDLLKDYMNKCQTLQMTMDNLLTPIMNKLSNV